MDEKAVPIALEIEKNGEYYYIAVDSDKTTDDILSVAGKENNRLADFEELGRRISDREYTELTQDDSVKLVIADLDNREVRIFDENDVLTSISLDESIEEQAVAGDHEPTFAEQVDKVLAGNANRYNDLKVCDTPDILLQIGCEQLPMFYTHKHLRDAMRKKGNSGEAVHHHGLAVEQIKEIPEQLKDPVMIYDSLSRSDSIVVVTSMLDKDDCPIVAAIRPHGKARYELEFVDSNFVLSFHGRENFESQLNRALKNDKLLFCNKQKSQELFRVLGLQLSEGVNNLSFDTIIHQSRNIVKGFDKTSDKKEEKNTVADITISQEQFNAMMEKLGKLDSIENQLMEVQSKLSAVEKNQKVIQAFMVAATAAKTFPQVMQETENVTMTMTGADRAKFFCYDTAEDKFFSQNGSQREYRTDNTAEQDVFSTIREEAEKWQSFDEWHVFEQPDGSVMIPIVSNDSRFMGVIRAEGEFSPDKSEFEGYRPESEILNTIDLALQKENTHQQGITDELTQLKNRQGMNEYISSVISENIQQEKPVVLVMCDIDHFKSVNDTYGHDAGDTVLANVAKILRENTRTGEDGAFRFGGEEMICVMNCDPEQAYRRAEEIRRLVEETTHNVTLNGEETQINVTISMGVYQIDPSMVKEFDPARSQAELREAFDAEFKNVDSMVYQSKENGRNRITTSPEIYDKVIASKAADLMHIEKTDPARHEAVKAVEAQLKEGNRDVVIEAVSAMTDDVSSIEQDMAEKSTKTRTGYEKIGTVDYSDIKHKAKTDGIKESDLARITGQLDADDIGYWGVKRDDGTYTIIVEKEDIKAFKSVAYAVENSENRKIQDPAYINDLDNDTMRGLAKHLRESDIDFSVEKWGDDKYSVIVEKPMLETVNCIKDIVTQKWGMRRSSQIKADEVIPGLVYVEDAYGAAAHFDGKMRGDVNFLSNDFNVYFETGEGRYIYMNSIKSNETAKESMERFKEIVRNHIPRIIEVRNAEQANNETIGGRSLGDYLKGAKSYLIDKANVISENIQQEIDFTLGLDGEKIESDLSTRVDKSETQEPQEKGDISPLSPERKGTVGDFLKDTLTPYFDKVIDFCKDVIARDEQEQEQVNAHTL